MSALLYRHSVRLRAARVGWPGARIRAPVVEGGDGGGGAASRARSVWSWETVRGATETRCLEAIGC